MAKDVAPDATREPRIPETEGADERAGGLTPEAVRLHRDLLALRREDPVIRAQRVDRFHGAVLRPDAFLLRWRGGEEDRLLAVNLGADLPLVQAAEPLLAPPTGHAWEIVWSSEAPGYGGRGIDPLYRDGNPWFPGGAAVLLRA